MTDPKGPATPPFLIIKQDPDDRAADQAALQVLRGFGSVLRRALVSA